MAWERWNYNNCTSPSPLHNVRSDPLDVQDSNVHEEVCVRSTWLDWVVIELLTQQVIGRMFFRWCWSAHNIRMMVSISIYSKSHTGKQTHRSQGNDRDGTHIMDIITYFCSSLALELLIMLDKWNKYSSDTQVDWIPATHVWQSSRTMNTWVISGIDHGYNQIASSTYYTIFSKGPHFAQIEWWSGLVIRRYKWLISKLEYNR